MGSLEDFPINFLLASLFIIALFSFGVGIAENYGYDEDLMTLEATQEYNYSDIKESVSGVNTQTTEWLNRFREDKPSIYYGGIVLLSIWGFINNILGLTHQLWIILSRGMVDVMGIDPLVLGVITSIIFILIGMYAWKKIKTGQ